jgi:hypothetical protein
MFKFYLDFSGVHVMFKFYQVPKLYLIPTKNLIELKHYMNTTKILIELKHYMNPTKNLIEPKGSCNV